MAHRSPARRRRHAETSTITDLRIEQIAQDTGFSSLLYRLHLTGDPGVPSTVIVKLPAQSEARWAMDMLGGYRRELSFYQYVAGKAPIATPHVYAAGMAEDSADFVLVLEDLRDWDNADHLAGLSMHRARLCIAQLAAMHAWSVTAADATALDAFPSLDTPIAREILHPAFELGMARVPRQVNGARFPPRWQSMPSSSLNSPRKRWPP